MSITPQHFRIGLRGVARPFVDAPFARPVKASESFWTLEDGVVHVRVQKLQRGEPWPFALVGHGGELNAFENEEVKKRLMLERFQTEHPGFDFSGAEFSGTAPDASKFLGGI